MTIFQLKTTSILEFYLWIFSNNYLLGADVYMRFPITGKDTENIKYSPVLQWHKI